MSRRGYRRYSPSDKADRDAKRRAFSDSIGGIDRDIQELFLALAEDTLEDVFCHYGEIHGKGAVNYAKRTYPHWKSGNVKMSGVVASRLINAVPRALDVATRFDWVKRLRRQYLRKERRTVECNPSNWFRKVQPIVDELIEASSRFRLPDDVIEKLKWLAEDDMASVHSILAAVEMDEAKLRTERLAEEYYRIGYLLRTANGQAICTHTIEIPQGTVEVRITLPKRTIFQALTLSSGEPHEPGKGILYARCKNPSCNAELETSLAVYPGEPIVCAESELGCPRCGGKFTYAATDLRHIPVRQRIEIRQRLFGRVEIAYDCPRCGTDLISPIQDAGGTDTCPKCRKSFRVPNVQLK